MQIDLIGTLRRMMNQTAAETFDPATDSLEAIRDFLISFFGEGLCYFGTIDSIPGANQFTISELAGLGDAKFTGAYPYRVFVLWDSGGAGAAPQSEMQAITAYVSAPGTFTHNAFTVALVAGDQVAILHPRIAEILDVVTSLGGATGIFHEQADVPVNINAIAASETDVLNLAAADTRYVVRHLRLKCANPGANTVTVRLYELVNDVLTEVDSFDITAANFDTHHSLMDMFGLSHLAGDALQVTVRASAGGPYQVLAQYSYGKNNI